VSTAVAVGRGGVPMGVRAEELGMRASRRKDWGGFIKVRGGGWIPWGVRIGGSPR